MASIDFAQGMASEFKSKKDPAGFVPLAEQGEGQFFYPSESTLVQTCLCLTSLPPHDKTLKYLHTLKIPNPSAIKE